MNDKATGTSEQVLDYYSRNWEKIAHCYALDDNGMPVDPAWYRRRFHQQFLDEEARIADRYRLRRLDGKGRVRPRHRSKGIEPVRSSRSSDATCCPRTGSTRVGSRRKICGFLRIWRPNWECISLLSVLLHVKADRWDHYHEQMPTLKPGGRLFAAYATSCSTRLPSTVSRWISISAAPGKATWKVSGTRRPGTISGVDCKP